MSFNATGKLIGFGQGQVTNQVTSVLGVSSAGGATGTGRSNGPAQTPEEAEAQQSQARKRLEADLKAKRAKIIEEHVATSKTPTTREEILADRDELTRKLLDVDPERDVLLLQQQMIDLRQNVLPDDLRDNLTVVNVNRLLDGIALQIAKEQGGLLGLQASALEALMFRLYPALKRLGIEPRGKHESSPHHETQDQSFEDGQQAVRDQGARRKREEQQRQQHEAEQRRRDETHSDEQVDPAALDALERMRSQGSRGKGP